MSTSQTNPARNVIQPAVTKKKHPRQNGPDSWISPVSWPVFKHAVERDARRRRVPANGSHDNPTRDDDKRGTQHYDYERTNHGRASNPPCGQSNPDRKCQEHREEKKLDRPKHQRRLSPATLPNRPGPRNWSSTASSFTPRARHETR